MTDELPLQHLQKQSSAYIYFLSIYFITIGVLYLWGYWSPFDVNILEYLNLTDIVRLTAYPIASSFGFLALGMILGGSTGLGTTLPSGGGRNTPTGQILNKYKSLFVALYVLVVLVILLFGSGNKWFILPFLLYPFIFPYLSARNFLVRQIPADKPREICVLLLVVAPFFAFGYGRLTAYEIIDGKKFSYVLSAIDNVSVPLDAEPNQRVRLIGHAGDFLFFWEPKNSILMISKFEGEKILMLGRFEQKDSVLPQEVPSNTEKKL
jgi:hypothetical protein